MKSSQAKRKAKNRQRFSRKEALRFHVQQRKIDCQAVRIPGALLCLRFG